MKSPPRVFCAGFLLVLAGCEPASFSGSTKVELVRVDHRHQKIRAVVQEGPALGALLAPLGDLAPEEPCACAHLEFAYFHRPDGSVLEVSLCMHCFDVPATGGHYRMPPAFYKAFEAHLATAAEGK